MPAAWTSEDLTAQVDGVAAQFTTSQDFRADSVLPRVNGLLCTDGMTEDSSTEFTLNNPPKVGDDLIVHYTLL